MQTPFPPHSEDRQENSDIDIEQLEQFVQQEAAPLIIERCSINQTRIDYPLATIIITFNQLMISVSSFDKIINIDDFGISLIRKLEGR